MLFHSEETYLNWFDELAEQEFLIIDNFIDTTLYNKLFSFLQKKKEADVLKKAGIGALSDFTIDKKIRGDFVFWLDRQRDEELGEFYALIDELIYGLRRFCYLPIQDFEFHLSHYPVGTFYKAHVDSFQNRSNRIISFVLYLNPDWKEGDGGELVIHKDGETLSFPPVKGRLALFKSDTVLHEVAITNTDRYSLTGWLLNNPVGVGFLGN